MTLSVSLAQALVRERIKDWGAGLCKALGKRLVELTGDYTPDLRALLGADVIIATPEKWDGISRAWHTRAYVKKVCLLVIDEIHLLGADRCVAPPACLFSLVGYEYEGSTGMHVSHFASHHPWLS